MSRNFNKFRGDRNKKNFRRDNNEKSSWKTEERIEEPSVGISEYISDHDGFTGIIKSRFSDFQVNEIDSDDKECVLNDFTIPDPDTIDIGSDVEEIEKLLDEEQLKLIQEISDSKEREESKTVEVDVTDFDKEKRSSLHKSLKMKFGRYVSANTVDKEDRKFIVIRKKNKNDRSTPGRWQYPHEFVHFVMYKENIDTLQAISSLSNKLRMKPALFAYSGTKDKRAKTCQWISVKRVEPSKICQSAKNCQGVRVGNFKFSSEPLKLGSLNGNRFRIALRAVNGERSHIEKGLESLRDLGFINYYGLQRFGNCVKVPTYLIGKALLTENFSEACKLIMTERDGEPHYMTKMRSTYAETKDPHQALKILHSTNTCTEARLLRGLVKHGDKNYLQALLMLPRNMLMLYTHAYQSYIFNQIASKRRVMGLKVIEGDLVFTETSPKMEVEIVEQSENDENGNEDANEVVESKYLTMVRSLTEEDVESGKFTIYDIVLPLPGHDIKYPSNEIQETYKELLAKDNLTSENMKNKHNMFSLNGAYRKVFVKPEKVSWKFLKYSGQTDLILSDYSKMCGDPEPEDDENGDNLSLVVDFVLPPSAYATMALRELMKCDTNVGNHIKMENQLKLKEEEEQNKKRKIEEVIENDEEDKATKIIKAN